MSLVKLGRSLQDVEELSVAPEGRYTLIIRSCVIHEKADKIFLRPTLVFEGMPEYESFDLFLGLPSGSDDETVATNKLRRLKRFFSLAGVDVDMNEFDTEDLLGLAFNGTVVQEVMTNADGTQQMNDSGEPRMRNNLIIPRIQ